MSSILDSIVQHHTTLSFYLYILYIYITSVLLLFLGIYLIFPIILDLNIEEA